MSCDPSLANGFGYAGWCFAPAIVFYERNMPDVAKVAISNMGQDALNWLQQRGAPVEQILSIQDAVSCNNASGAIRSWLIQYFRNEFGYAQGYMFDIGMGIGSARTHCMPDGIDPSRWEEQWPQERYATISGLQLALGLLPACLMQFEEPIRQIIFDLNSCPPFSNDIQGSRILPLLDSIPQAYVQNGP